MLIIETSRAYGRGCLTGIAAYIRAHGPWQVLHLERSIPDELPAEIDRWRGDGVLARIETPQLARKVRAMKLPTVDLRGTVQWPGLAALDTDHAECARLAAEHFHERGYHHLAFCGFPTLDFSDRRCEHFLACAQATGRKPLVYRPSKRTGKQEGTTGSERYGETHITELVPWLKKLPKPVGVFACNDVRGRQVLQAAGLAGLRVPDEVAVLGVDNDTVMCDLSNPPLSSIEPDTRRLGYLSAEILDRLIDGEDPPESPVLVPPTGIVHRRSTDAIAIDDERIVRAIGYIREHACSGISVEDVAKAGCVSRATLERRFAHYLGRTPRREIERVRLERVCRLLVETDYTLEHIAELTAFGTASHMASMFRSRFDQTPGLFREEARLHRRE